MIHHRHFKSFTKRALLSAAIVAGVTLAGTVGMHFIEGMEWLDAFYFTSMIATAQGSAVTPSTTGGKIFAALLSYISVGACVTALGFLFGPLFGKLWRVGAIKLEEEAEKASHRKKS